MTPSVPLGLLPTVNSPLPAATAARPSRTSLTTSTVCSESGSAPAASGLKHWNCARSERLSSSP